MSDKIMDIINFIISSPYIGAIVFLIGLGCMSVGMLVAEIINYVRK